MSEREIERYVRASVVLPGGSVEVRLQRPPGEPVRWRRQEIAMLVERCIRRLRGGILDEDNAGSLTDDISEQMEATWPALAWCFEVRLADVGRDEPLTMVSSRRAP